jgi:hypothetical protein
LSVRALLRADGRSQQEPTVEQEPMVDPSKSRWLILARTDGRSQHSHESAPSNLKATLGGVAKKCVSFILVFLLLCFQLVSCFLITKLLNCEINPVCASA